jgi:hypothetical protein
LDQSIKCSQHMFGKKLKNNRWRKYQILSFIISHKIISACFIEEKVDKILF